MRLFSRLRRLPTTVRVPLMVVALMVGVSVVLSERVLDQLSKTQATYLHGLASAYLDGLIASITPSVLRQDSWEIFDGIERLQPTTDAILPTETVVTDKSGRVLAASDPTIRRTLDPIEATFAARFRSPEVAIDPDTKSGYIQRAITYQGKTIGAVFAVFDITSLLEERQRVFVTLLATNSLITALLAMVGFLCVRRMIRPMQVLETHMLEAAAGSPTPIKEGAFPVAGGEASRLYHAYNELVKSDKERQYLSKQLAEEEKLASLGRLASSLAHEINNPLGGLMNVIDTLRRHGENRGVRQNSIELIQRGLSGIREVVQATLATHRPERLSRPIESSDFSDLKFLVRPELRRRQQTLEIDAPSCVPLRREWPAGPIRQAVLNLLLNAIAASPPRSRLAVEVEITAEHLQITVSDEGGGVPQAAKAVLERGGRPSAPEGRGLGLWVVREIANDLDARIEVVKVSEKRSAVRMCLPRKVEEPKDVA